MKEDETDALKVRMREHAKALRTSLSPEERTAAAYAIAAQDLGFLGALADREISGYAAMRGELDPAPLLDRLRGAGAHLSLPRITNDKKSIVFRRWHPDDPMSSGVWGIREPLPESPTVEPDIVLLPLLAFDTRGYRIGYGGGYYDRVLARLRSAGPVLAVGLAFACLQVDAVPHLDYDQRLDWVLTPEAPLKMAG